LIIQNWNREAFGVSLFDELFPVVPIATYVITALSFGATLVVICKRNLRDQFVVNPLTMIATIGFTALITIFMLFPYL